MASALAPTLAFLASRANLRAEAGHVADAVERVVGAAENTAALLRDGTAVFDRLGDAAGAVTLALSALLAFCSDNYSEQQAALSNPDFLALTDAQESAKRTGSPQSAAKGSLAAAGTTHAAALNALALRMAGSVDNLPETAAQVGGGFIRKKRI
jgi:hypothetical protein